jgi:hypothetical protein
MISQSTIDRLLKDQQYTCELCWQHIPPYHAHHAVYTKDKRFASYLDMPENLILLCPECHADHGKLSNWFMRCVIWSRKIDKGYDMVAWHEAIPMLIKDEFIYFEDKKGV